MPRRNTENTEMTTKIKADGGHLADMWARRTGGNVYTRVRMCNFQEAINTWMYCLAGGAHVSLTEDKPSEAKAVDQVGNNESMVRSGPVGVDPRLAVLAKIKAKGGTVHEEAKKRDVVEYSLRVASQFSHGGNTAIKVGVNSAFCVAGSGLSFEGGGGTVVQIGTPLAWVEVDTELLQVAFPDKLV